MGGKRHEDTGRWFSHVARVAGTATLVHGGTRWRRHRMARISVASRTIRYSRRCLICAPSLNFKKKEKKGGGVVLH